MMNNDVFENQLFALTTIILTKFEAEGKVYTGTASGFYYTILTPTDPQKTGPQWNRIDGQWLITNKHVIVQEYKGAKHLVDELTFCLRTIDRDIISWLPIVMKRDEILANTKVHQVDNIDVVAIDVSEYIKDKLLEGAKTAKRIMMPGALSNKNLPDNQPLVVDVTSDIIVASYPKGFYDEVNKFPIVKSGIIASGWGVHFRGDPIFEIDAQLFPGSSGGLVISKPTNIAMFDGSLHRSDIKQFVFLGVYSGEYMWKEEITDKDGVKHFQNRSYGLGNVWYSYLVPEVINMGHSLASV